MRALAVESSSSVAAVAIVDEEKLIAEYVLNHRRTHSRKLMPLVEEALCGADLNISDIDIFAVASGPGSFTGLRIGISTVKALAQALNKPVVGIPTLDGLAYNLPCVDCIICPIMDARRQQVYTSVYRWRGEELERLEEYMALPIIDLIHLLKSKNRQVIFNGDGVPVYREIIVKKMGDSAKFAPPPHLLQRASSIAHLAIKKALKGESHSFLDLKPFYLRKSQAEQKYEKTLSREG